MQKIAREFLRFKHGMLLKSILENNTGTFASLNSPSLSQPLKFITTSSIEHNQAGSSSYHRSNKKCGKRCRRGPLPWEKDEEPKPCKGILPFRKAVEDYIELSETEYAGPCRFCPPTNTGKASSKKKKKSKKKKTPTCKPFQDQNVLSKKKSECEKRRIVRCKKKACNPEIECANLAPTCKNITKIYPMSFIKPKPITGCPATGWQTLHKKAQKECKDH